jgi:tRNA threonylcarbamoyladenosine biosynthesis protein TsaB
MMILGIDSSAVSAGAAIVKDGKLIAETYLNLGLTHSETLMTLIDTCLRNAGVAVKDMDAFAIAKGPGSFTGVRIGISAVKGLVFGTDKKVYGVSTLEGLAAGVMLENYLICPVMDARCNQVYAAAFSFENGKLERCMEDCAIRLEDFYEYVHKQDRCVLLLGDGAGLTASYLADKEDVRYSVYPEIFRYQHGSGVAFAAWLRYNNGEEGLCGDALQPSYLRLPQAERERIKGEKKQ